MKKIVYLHGLESDQGGPKVDYLKTKGGVFAPEMEYLDYPETIFDDIVEEIKDGPIPDIIIGSSMGGYFAHNIAKKIGIKKVILFNPANINAKKYGVKVDETGEYEPEVTVCLGGKDVVVNPIMSYAYFKKLNAKIGVMPEMGHRTTLNVFKYVIEEENV